MNTITVTTEYQGFWQLFEASWAGAIEESTGAPPSDTEINDFIWFSLADEMNLDADEE